MGGTIASGVGAPMPTPGATAPIAPPPAATPMVGGGSSWSAPVAEPTLLDAPNPQLPPLAYTAPGVVGGGATSPSIPIANAQQAIPILQGLVTQLQAIIAAVQGGATITGGGPGQTPGQGAPTAWNASAPAAEPAPAPAAPATDPPPNSDVRQRIVQVARDELARGVREDAGKDKDKAGRIREYRTAVTGPGENPDAAEAWCADFASWVWKQAGTPFGPDGAGEDWTVAMVRKAKEMGSWKEHGSYEPKPGDLVLIDWKRGDDVDHVAVVEKVEGGKVYTIGGNESASVKAASYDLGDTRMMGFVTPKGA
jgi:cell wall-associated NlpC family hydrolase